MKLNAKNLILSFHDIFEPKASEDNPTLKYSATLICTPDTVFFYTKTDGTKTSVPHKSLPMLCEHVLKEKFGKVPGNFTNWFYNKADGTTSRKKKVNEDGEYHPGFCEDTMYVVGIKHADKCKDGIMTVIDQNKDAIAANSGALFSGCIVNACLDLYAYDDKKGGKLVTSTLEGIQLKKKGEPLGFVVSDSLSDFDEEEIEEDGAESLM